MHIDPDIEIAPVGYYYQEHFLDDEAAFKFTVQTDSISNIFNSDVIDSAKFVPRKSNTGLELNEGEVWWDPNLHPLVGDDFNVKSDAVNIGILDNDDGSFTVYVRWFET